MIRIAGLVVSAGPERSFEDLGKQSPQGEACSRCLVPSKRAEMMQVDSRGPRHAVFVDTLEY
jgi:hypothetical protein